MRWAIHDQEVGVAAAFAGGLRACGQVVSFLAETDVPDVGNFDGVVVVGISGRARATFDAYRERDRIAVLVDKGYTRSRKDRRYYRVSVNSHQPTRFLGEPHYPDRTNDRRRRAEETGVDLLPYSCDGNYVLVDLASYKYARWLGYRDHAGWSRSVVEKVVTSLPPGTDVVVRARPTDNPDPDMSGLPVRYVSAQSAADAVDGARVVVSHGGNLGVEAVLRGRSVFAAGNCAARPVAETDWGRIAQPRVLDDDDRRRWFESICCWQWTEDEIHAGAAWAFASRYVDGLPEPEEVATYRRLYRRMHAGSDHFRGATTWRIADEVARLVAETGARTLLDYGSGNKQQYQDGGIHGKWGGTLPTCYDPAVPRLAERPIGRFDGVLCSDVMEHVPEGQIDAVLVEICNYARKFVALSISCASSKKHLADGRGVHCTIRPPAWWGEKLRAAARPGQRVVANYYEVDGTGETKRTEEVGR